MTTFNEYSPIQSLAVRAVEQAFVDDERLDRDWHALRYHSRPELTAAQSEHQKFVDILRRHGADIISLDGNDDLTLDSIYTRDALIVTPSGLVLCNMGRKSRGKEPMLNAKQLQEAGVPVHGQIEEPGTVEGGDFIWLDNVNAAIGLGPRTNQQGIEQLQALLGNQVKLHIVPLPAPEHPEDVFHLMSMISPLDKDLALIYRPLMPESFCAFLRNLGVQLIDVPEDEFLSMGCNILATGPRRVVMLDQLPQTRSRLQAVGCDVTTYYGIEISRKGEGGPTCLTRPLIRSKQA
jgi:N-dimethylarginine dimethylaminohydrolase